MKRRNLFKILIGMLVIILLLWGIILYVYLDQNTKSDYYGMVYEREARLHGLML